MLKFNKITKSLQKTIAKLDALVASNEAQCFQLEDKIVALRQNQDDLDLEAVAAMSVSSNLKKLLEVKDG